VGEAQNRKRRHILGLQRVPAGMRHHSATANEQYPTSSAVVHLLPLRTAAKAANQPFSRDWRLWMEHHREARGYPPRAWA